MLSWLVKGFGNTADSITEELAFSMPVHALTEKLVVAEEVQPDRAEVPTTVNCFMPVAVPAVNVYGFVAELPAPVQAYVSPPLAVNTALSLIQITGLETEAVMVGLGATLRVNMPPAEQPLVEVPITPSVKVPPDVLVAVEMVTGLAFEPEAPNTHW